MFVLHQNFGISGLSFYRFICFLVWHSFSFIPKFVLSSGQRIDNFMRVNFLDFSTLLQKFIRSETKSLAARDEPRLSDPDSAASRSSSTSAALLSAREEALRTRRNVVKMLVACVSVYFVCYSPIQAIFLSRQAILFFRRIISDIIKIKSEAETKKWKRKFE